MEQLLQKLIKNPSLKLNSTELELLKTAYEFTETAHAGQLRKSGDPYISHAVETAYLLSSWGMDLTTIISGLLHDTVEDGGATSDDVTKLFGTEIATLVEGVTKVSHVKLKGSRQDEFVENLRKMVLVMAKDLRVVFIKLADRLHNMRTLEYLEPTKQTGFALETLEIYGPLADRLGMGEVAGELNDLAFKFAYPDQYAQLTSQTQALYSKALVYVEQLQRDLKRYLATTIPSVEVSARRKRLYSLYCKLQRPEIDHDITKIHDLVAARILTDTIEECYIALGLIHQHYRPVPYLGVSDYIANPKPNGYQSLHTKVFGPNGTIQEIQIRTRDMHQQAEIGLAAHFNYAAAKSKGLSDRQLSAGVSVSPQKLGWVKQLLAWQTQMTDNQEYYDALKFDAFADRILVFSPLGDVYDLPQDATPVDFAYAVHTDLGHQASAAKVNGKLVPLNYQLQNGDVVEVVIDRKKTKPNPDWLSFVATHTAKREIQKVSRSRSIST